MRQVLIERELWRKGLIGDCKLCKGKNKDMDSKRIDCCMHRILSLQPDFIAQKSRLQDEIEKRGHKCIFYPKFHCELNFIEMYWDAAKQYTRKHYDYTWKGLQKIVTRFSFFNYNSSFCTKIWRYMDIII